MLDVRPGERRVPSDHAVTASRAKILPRHKYWCNLANVTTSGHNTTMKHVRIAELKARLSEYLRAVRRGETISVLDRETPVAQIVPVHDRTTVRVRKPVPGTPPPNRV